MKHSCNIANHYWDPHRSIPPEKDLVKKDTVWTRERSVSELDHVLDKLLNMYEKDSIVKARVIFGTNLIELRYRFNPFCSKQYTLDEFLDLDPSTAFDFDDCKSLSLSDIDNSLIAMKSLRFLPQEFIEGSRINSFSSKIWAYLSSATSIIDDNDIFLKYSKLRTKNGHNSLNHDQAIELLGLGGENYFVGEKEFHQNRNSLCRMPSNQDLEIDKYNEIIYSMFEKNQIFEVQNYNGSGIIKVLTPENPYVPYAFRSVGELEVAANNYPLTPMTLEEALLNPNLNVPKRQSNIEDISLSFEVAKKNRIYDDTYYLRVIDFDFLFKYTNGFKSV